MKFATQPTQQYPPHLKHVVHYLGILKIQILCKYSADMEKCKETAYILSKLLYAAPAWSGSCSLADRGRLEASSVQKTTLLR